MYPYGLAIGVALLAMSLGRLSRRVRHRSVAAVYSDRGGRPVSDARNFDACGPDSDAKHLFLGVRALNGVFEPGGLFDAFLSAQPQPAHSSAVTPASATTPSPAPPATVTPAAIPTPSPVNPASEDVQISRDANDVLSIEFWGGGVYGQGPVQDRSILPVEMFPFFKMDDSLFFSDLRFFPTVEGTFGGNVGFGYRYYSKTWDRVFGISGWYDADGTRDDLLSSSSA